MKTVLNWSPIVLAMGVQKQLKLFHSVLVVMLCCTLAHADNQIKLSEDHLKNLGVTLGQLQTAEQVPLFTAPAKIVVPPEHEYVVSASQAGAVTKLNAAVGDTVKKGAVLAELNSSDLLTMQREYLKTMNELQLGTVFYQRDKKLVQEGVIADRRWQETQAQYHTFVSESNEHKQLLKIAGMSDADIAHLVKTHQLSGHLRLRSPIDGVVLERIVSSGERVDNLAPIYRIADLDELWLEINIPQERITSLNIGDSVQIENSDVTAVIRLLGKNVNPDNQTVLTRAVIQGKHTNIRTGQSVTVQLIQNTSLPIFKVPNSAIAQHEGQSYIFVRNASGFVATPINVIGKRAEDSIISGELNADRKIANTGAVALKANWLGLGSEAE